MKKTAYILLSIFGGSAVALATLFNALDTFVFPHVQGNIADLVTSSSSAGGGETTSGDSSESSNGSQGITITPSPYSSTSITASSGTEQIDSKSVPYYYVDIKLSSINQLKRNIVTDSSGNFGSNITQTFDQQLSSIGTSNIVAAMTGDTCFHDSYGYVIANGITYRNNKRSSTQDDFAIYNDGTVFSYNESDYSISSIASRNGLTCLHNFCFGPTLIKDSSINVTTTQEIEGKSMSANQRTSLGYIEPYHFCFLATGLYGKRSSSNGTGFSLYNLATFLKNKGCVAAYNLDGGGSAHLYSDGTSKSDLGDSSRGLSDIIYV